MHSTRWTPFETVLSLLLIAGIPAAAASEETSIEPPAETTHLAVPPSPACGAAVVSLEAGLTAEEKEPEPHGICNCNPENEEADCKRVCGDAGGSCLVTIPCEDPLTYSGWCYCNQRNAEPTG